MQYHSLNVSSLRRLTDQSIEVTFQIPENLSEQYTFEHGQFVNLRTTINGEQVERSYSICTAPYERKLSIAIKEVADGIFSTWANKELAEGDEIDVSTPMGTFTHELDSSKPKSYMLIAAGSGITPILSIAKQILAAETQSKVYLIYANKKPSTTMFFSELDSLSSRYTDRLSITKIYSESDDGDYFGRVTTDIIDQKWGEITKKTPLIKHVYICGPEAMTLALKSHISDNIDQDVDVHIELFNSSSKASNECDDGLGESKDISLEIDGEVIDFQYVDSTQSILEKALEYDPDLPYGCQNGSCGACQAKVIKGELTMEVNYALSESEVDEGFVLLCQAKPTTKIVHVSYDEE